MQNAYDNILQITVSANDAVLNRGFEPYRFECPYCGEEVHLAAPFSSQRTPHFRHLHGNNSVECENYFGLGSAIAMERKRKGFREVAEIYYNSIKKVFYLNIRFSEDELLHYEESASILEIRCASQKTPFKKIKINRTNFTPNIPSEFILDSFSDRYCLKIDNGEMRIYDFMSVQNAYFFKIQGDEENYIAKRLRSSEDTCVIYANTKYLILSLNPEELKRIKKVLAEDVDREFEIDTMNGMHFYGMEVCILNTNSYKRESLFSLGYRLEDNDVLDVLWPPYALIEGTYYIQDSSVYVRSSFEIHPHSGNNINEGCITPIDNGITKLSLSNAIKISRKNTDLQMVQRVLDQEFSNIPITITEQKKYIVPDDGLLSVLFDKSEDTVLNPGQNVFMSEGRIIKRYQNNIVMEIVLPQKVPCLHNNEIVKDANKYYRYKVNDAEYSADYSDFGKEYIENNKQNFNNAVIRMIKEGKI